MALVFSIYFCTCFIYSYDKALANAVRFFAKNDIASIKVRRDNAKDAVGVLFCIYSHSPQISLYGRFLFTFREFYATLIPEGR